MPPTRPKPELDDVDVAIALLKGGLSWRETVAVINHIKFDKSKWNGQPVISLLDNQIIGKTYPKKLKIKSKME